MWPRRVDGKLNGPDLSRTTHAYHICVLGGSKYNWNVVVFTGVSFGFARNLICKKKGKRQQLSIPIFHNIAGDIRQFISNSYVLIGGCS